MIKTPEEINERVIEEAECLRDGQLTVREVAKKLGISKSTVHLDLVEKLPKINSQLAKEVQVILQRNKAERSIRAGKATKEKYDSLRKK